MMWATGAGETRLHSSVPLLMGSVALLSMAFFLDHNPSAAFVSLLVATVIWGSSGVVYGLPASFLSVSPAEYNLHALHASFARMLADKGTSMLPMRGPFGRTVTMSEGLCSAEH